MSISKNQPISDKIQEALENAMELSSLDIHVDHREGVVVLTGFVNTLAEKAFAQKVAGQIEGVEKVENYLTIATDGTLTDDEIQAHIEQHLRESPFSEELSGVGVKVDGGSAVLMGQVRTLSDKTNAIKETQKATGVKNVVSKIEITSPRQREFAEMTDDQITSTIAQRLSNTGVSIPDIHVSTVRGKVTLRGYAANKHSVEIAKEIAMDVEGVKKVHSLLKLRDEEDSSF